MADTILPSPPPPAVPQGWESGWSNEYKTWFYVNKFTGQSSWEPPTQPVFGPPLGSAVTPPGQENPEFPGPPKGEGDGERGLFTTDGPNGRKPNMLGKAAMGVGAFALLGTAVHEWDKRIGSKSDQSNGPPPQQAPEPHWWQSAQIPSFGSPPPNQAQKPSQASLFSAFTGGDAAVITAPGACSSGAGQVHDFGGSSWYNVPVDVPVSKETQSKDWRMCRKCLILNWAAKGNGPCAAGGKHDNSGSRNYCIDSGQQGQKNWHFCNKCHCLGFNGNNDIGKCPGGGVHDHTNTWDFGIQCEHEGGEDRWKWCRHCQQLCFDGWH